MHKILIVEDEEALRELYIRVLSDAGFTVEDAASGEEALSKLAVFKPDLILLDLILPHINGFQVLDKIKQDPTLKGAKVIVLTNIYPDKKDLLDHGADDVMIKVEHTPDQVIKRIQEVLAITTPA